MILRSEAHPGRSLAADWGKTARKALRALLDRIEAEAAGRLLRALAVEVADPRAVLAEAETRFAARAPFGAAKGRPLVLHVAAEKLPRSPNGCATSPAPAR